MNDTLWLEASAINLTENYVMVMIGGGGAVVSTTVGPIYTTMEAEPLAPDAA